MQKMSAPFRTLMYDGFVRRTLHHFIHGEQMFQMRGQRWYNHLSLSLRATRCYAESADRRRQLSYAPEMQIIWLRHWLFRLQIQSEEDAESGLLRLRTAVSCK